MKISVIVPVYNVSEYLKKCLDSLLQQTFKNMEIIIVNDGSTDNSEEIVKEYQKRVMNIKYYYKENGGLSSARNYGLQYAEGEYVAFVDSDDFISFDMMEKMYNEITVTKTDICVCEFNYVYGDKVVRSYSNLNYTDIPDKKYLLTPPMACTRLYKRELFNNIKFKEGIFYEDLELNPKLVKYTKNISFVNEGLYFYVVRSGSIMKQKEFNNKLYDIFTVLDSNKELLQEEYPDEIEYMYIIHLLRSASLRFMEYDNFEENINKIIEVMDKEFPNWKNNPYYLKSGYKIKLICNLVYKKKFKLLNYLKKVTGK